MRDESHRLADIVQAARLIQSWIAGRSLQDFLADKLLQSGVLHQLAIIGEASRALSEATRSAMPEAQ